MSLKILTGIFFLVSSLKADVITLMRSSDILNLESSMYFSFKKFNLPINSKAWKINWDSSQLDQLKLESTSSNKAQMSVHLSRMERKLNLSQYAKKWTKEYSQFGFDLMKVQNIKVNNSEVLLIDVYHPKLKKQLRQYIAIKNDQVLLVGCQSQPEVFASAVESCEESVKKMSWL